MVFVFDWGSIDIFMGDGVLIKTVAQIEPIRYISSDFTITLLLSVVLEFFFYNLEKLFLLWFPYTAMLKIFCENSYYNLL